MIENLTSDELNQLLKELRTKGFTIRENAKETVFRDEVEKLFGHDVYVVQDIRNSIYMIADFITDNFTEQQTKNGRTRMMRNKNIVREKDAEYRRIIRGILEVIQPNLKQR